MISPKKESNVSSIIRAAGILVCLSRGYNTVTDISVQCKLSKSTVHRLLNTLAEPRFTMYDPVNHRYYPGPLITQLAANTETNHQPLLLCAAEEMKSLANITEETVTLTLLIGFEFVGLHAIESKHSLKVEEPKDSRDLRPFLPGGAMQKVLLSQLNDKDLLILLRSFENWNTRHEGAIDIGLLEVQIARIKQQGYYYSAGERIPGSICISAPVSHYVCPVALGIMGPETRIRPNLEKLAENLKSSAGRISADLANLFR